MRHSAIAWGLMLGTALAGLFATAQAQNDEPLQAARPVVFISDTHFGLGRKSSSEWYPYEDFRWSDAWRGFLKDIDARHHSRLDLVVLGDFLELWQPYEGMACTTPSADLGCTEAETLALAQRVITAHRSEIEALNHFATQGENRVYIVPGNHDAALLLPDVQAALLNEFSTAGRRRISIETDGIWASDSGKIVGEHGHQIGKDVNRYASWPSITLPGGTANHVVRPWGEQFVQKIFNSVEAEYPLIDNLSPESAGARYRLADKGYVKTAADLARFLTFNLFETSVRQKGMVLSNSRGEPEPWDLRRAKTLGYKLVVAALPSDDPMSALVIDSKDESRAMREELNAHVATLTDDELVQLCDHAAIQGRIRCAPGVLSGAAEALFNTKEAVVKKHLAGLESSQPKMKIYVYGHTHQYEVPWTARLTSNRVVTVSNTGAFQRVIGESGFKVRMIRKGLKPSEALKGIALEELPKCYTFVEVDEGAEVSTYLRSWSQGEGELGRLVGPTDPSCQ